MVRRAAEGERDSETCQARVKDIKQSRIFDCKEPGEPRVVDIVDREPRLKAGESLRRAQEAPGRLAQLGGIRRILGIEDRQKLAAREREGNIKGSRFRLRRPGAWHDRPLRLRALCRV